MMLLGNHCCFVRSHRWMPGNPELAAPSCTLVQKRLQWGIHCGVVHCLAVESLSVAQQANCLLLPWTDRRHLHCCSLLKQQLVKPIAVSQQQLPPSMMPLPNLLLSWMPSYYRLEPHLCCDSGHQSECLRSELDMETLQLPLDLPQAHPLLLYEEWITQEAKTGSSSLSPW